MRPLTFKQQILLGLFVTAAAYVLAYTFDLRSLVGIGWTFFGVSFINNPVAPEVIRFQFEDKTNLIMRIVGIALIIGGWISILFLPAL